MIKIIVDTLGGDRSPYANIEGALLALENIKDVHLKEEYTFQLEECACGEGALDIKL